MKRTGRLIAILALLLTPAHSGVSNEAERREKLVRVERLIREGELDAAQKEADLALQEFPDDAALLNARGVVAAQRGDSSAAQSDFERAVAGTPPLPSAYLNLARLYQEHGDARAIDIYRRLLGFEPANSEAAYQVAFLSFFAGHYADSRSYLGRLSRDARSRPQALALECAQLSISGADKGAETTATQLLSSPGFRRDDIVPYYSALGSNNPRLLGRLLAGLVANKQAEPGDRKLLADLQEQSGNLMAARGLLEDLATDAAASPALLMDLARVAYLQRDLKDALGVLARAAKLEPANARICFLFGMIAVELNLPAEAKEWVGRALVLDPENPPYNYAMGAILLSGKTPGDAIPLFETYCRLKQGDPRGRFALGVAFYHAGEFDRARVELSSVAANPETTAGVGYYLGRLAAKDEDFETAKKWFLHSIASNPGFAGAHAELGATYLKLGWFREAEDSLDRAVSIEPDGYLPNLNLLKFYQRSKDPRAKSQALKFAKIQETRAEQEKLLWRRLRIEDWSAR